MLHNVRNVGWCSWWSGWFMNSVVGKARKLTPHTLKDTIFYDEELDVELNFSIFQSIWQAAATTPSKSSSNTSATPSLVRVLWRTFRKQLLSAALLKLGWSLFTLLSISFFVRELLKTIEQRSRKPGQEAVFIGHENGLLDEQETGWILCAFFWLTCVCLSICLQQMTLLSSKVGLRMKAAVTTSVYRKLFTYDKHRSQIDVVSLVATDCAKLAEACTTLQYLWSGIVEATAIMAVLLGFVGKAALPGCGIIILLLPVQYVCGILIARMRKRVVEASDARVNLMDEILRAIKLVKMYAWERKFADSVSVLRSQQTRLMVVGGWLKTINITIVFILPPLMGLSIFGVYELEHDLKPALAFTTLSLFNTLRLPLIQLPKSLRALGEGAAACERIQRFLMCPDQAVPSKGAKVGDTSICFNKAHFTYGTSEQAVLHDITIKVPQGKMLMIAGPVGCGKSSMLQAMMGQMTTLSGEDSVWCDFVYVPQAPWCQHGTVRDNILFGKPYREKHYKQVLHACALEADLLLMEHGDRTEIGERGSNLSGGQKQRIALARAAYSGATGYLLDSPLSAVDMYTCTHIFKHCIQDLMVKRGATVVLVTHQVELFVHANVIAIMDKGATKYVGPYDPAALVKFYPDSAILGTTAAQIVAQNRNLAVTNELVELFAAQNLPPDDAIVRQISHSKQEMDDVAAMPVHEALNPFGPSTSRANLLRAALALGDDVLQPAEPQTQGPSDGIDFTINMSSMSEDELSNQDGAAAFVIPPPIKYGTGGPHPVVVLLLEMKWYLAIISLSIFVSTQLARIYGDIWISKWASLAYGGTGKYYIGIYAGYVSLFFVLLLCRGGFFFWMGNRAATRMHAQMFKAMLRAPLCFFTSTPLGNVLAAFSKDMDCIDEALLDEIFNLGCDTMILSTTIGVVIKVVPVFAVVVAVLGVSLAYYFNLYMLASSVLKDVAGASTNSVVASTSETMQGIDVIRAFKTEELFKAKNTLLLSTSTATTYNLSLLQLWLSARLDGIGCLLVLATCLLAIGITTLRPADAGLAVSNSFQILLFFSWMVKQAADIGCYIASVGRVAGLAKVEAERDIPKSITSCPRDPWPAHGAVSFHDVVMSYSPMSPAVLKGVTFEIQAAEKVGVVGRTGAGKSSLIMAMFRLTDLSSGAVSIDGVDIGLLNLQELRRRISIIPQEPVCFRGTLRSNLDPFGEFPDEHLVIALNKCLLKTSGTDSLNESVAHMGSNFSLGQQQLICLARAMLKQSKLLLLDEATASLDSDTDSAVQAILRSNFSDRTMITIAHRLDTIIDSDKILVMDAGKVAEFDTPHNLLQQPESIFTSLCKQAGDQFEVLRRAADRHHICQQVLLAHVQDVQDPQASIN